MDGHPAFYSAGLKSRDHVPIPLNVMPSGTPPRRPRGALALIALACACALAPGSALGAGPGDGHDLGPRLDRSQPEAGGAFVAGEAIVRFEPGARAATRRAARKRAGVAFEDTLGLPRAQVVAVKGPVQSAVRRLEAQLGVAYAQPNYRYEAAASAPEPSDSFFGQLWGLDDPEMPNPGVGALDAWEAGKKGDGQVIAILDTGVDLTHPDLVDNLWENPDSGAEDVHGYDFVDNDPDPDDYNFHGTHVAGTAAATSDNNEGIAGVAPAAQIMAVRVLDGDGSGSTAEIAAGIDYAADNGAGVLNMSLGGPSGGGDKAMEDAITRAGEAEAVVVVAAGNEGADNDTEPHTPCALPNPNLICVAALTQGTGALAGFSNYGKGTVDIAAPGTSVLSTKPDYGPPLFSDGFEAEPSIWSTQVANGGVQWELSNSAASGAKSATDSPDGDYGQAEDNKFYAESYLHTTSPVNLTGERGCRVHFKGKYEVEPFFDAFVAGGWSPGIEGIDVLELDGESSGFPASFVREEASISDLDGLGDVHPLFGIWSDYELEFDGAYVDDVRLICRAETYENKIVEKSSEYDLPESGNYVRFGGTSMASPHLAGVVALVRAAVPGLNAGGVIDAVLNGASAIPATTTGKRTATEGIADACKAVVIATEGDIDSECLASSEPETQPEVKSGDGEVVTPELQGTPPSVSDSAAPTESASLPRIDRTSPRTGFRRKPPRVLLTPRRRGKAVFRFRSNEASVVYLCQFDRKRYRKCGERFVRWFLHGRHVLRVRARDAAGNVDRTPAVHRFRVKRGKSNRNARRPG